MEEDIKILEEIVELYYDCAGNEEGYDMRVDMAFMKRETQALENLIKGYRDLHLAYELYKSKYEGIEEDYTIVYLNSVYDERDKWKSKIKEKIEELENIKLCSGNINQAITEDKIKLLQELKEDK